MDVTDFSEDFDTEDNENDPFVGRKSKINLRDMDYVSWRRDLKADLDVLELLILMLRDITSEHDTKLQQLVADLKNKFEHPINGSNKKVLIFTAFADTAFRQDSERLWTAYSSDNRQYGREMFFAETEMYVQ